MGLLKLLFPPPSKDKFSRLVTKSLKSRGETRAIGYDRATFALRFGDFQTSKEQLFLGNFYADYCNVPYNRRKSVLAACSNARSARPEDVAVKFADAKPHLLPRVRDRWFYDCTLFQLKLPPGKKSPFIFRPLAEHYGVEIVYDLPAAIMSITDEKFEQWAVSFDDAMAAARDNLWKISNKDFKRLGPGTYISDWRDNYDASRLVLHDLIWQLPVKGKHVAAIPNRDILIVTGSDDAEGLHILADITTQALAAPRPISGFPVILEGTQWMPFSPAPDAPGYAELTNLTIRCMSDQYVAQKDLLNAKYKSQADPPFVASLMVLQHKDFPVYRTMTSWTEGCDALLPRADRVMLSSPGATGKPQMLGEAPWERVQSVAGQLLELQEMYPPRWRVRSFPTPQQLHDMALKKV